MIQSIIYLYLDSRYSVETRPGPARRTDLIILSLTRHSDTYLHVIPALISVLMMATLTANQRPGRVLMNQSEARVRDDLSGC